MTDRLHLEIIRTDSGKSYTPICGVRVYNGDIYLGDLPATGVDSKAVLGNEKFYIELSGLHVKVKTLDTPYPDDPRVQTDELKII